MKKIRCPQHKQQPARSLSDGWFRCDPPDKKCKYTVRAKASGRG